MPNAGSECSIAPYANASKTQALSPMLDTSARWALFAWVRLTEIHARTMVVIATGTVTKKMLRQPNAWMSRPPSVGPSAIPTPLQPAQSANVRARSAAFSYASVKMAKLVGMAIAAPSPATARAITSICGPVASVHARQATAKSDVPMMKTRLRP